MWQQIAFNRKLTKIEILEGLSSIFKIKIDEIQLIRDFCDLKLKIEKHIKIVCETAIAKTKYPLLLTIVIYDESLVPSNDILVVGELCEILNCEAYIGDDSPSYYSMLLVKSKNEYYQVSVEAEDFEHFKKSNLR